MISDSEIAELERLEAAATSGPWEVGQPGTWDEVPGYLVTGGVYKEFDDAALIVAARNALPKLLAEIRELKAQMACEVAVNADYPDVVQERDDLRRVVGRLQRGEAIESDYIDELKLARDERDALKVEVEKWRRLRDNASDYVDECLATIANLRAEILELKRICTDEAFKDSLLMYKHAASERDRYLTALKAPVLRRAQHAFDDNPTWQHYTGREGGITFRVTRAEDGTLTAEEVTQ